MTSTKAGDLLSAPEVGRRLGISTRDVYDLVDSKQLPAVRTKQGIRIPVDAVELRQATAT